VRWGKKDQKVTTLNQDVTDTRSGQGQVIGVKNPSHKVGVADAKFQLRNFNKEINSIDIALSEDFNFFKWC